MERLLALRDWIDQNRDIGLDVVRFYIGVGLFLKGVQFVSNESFLLDSLGRTPPMPFLQTALAHLVPLAHLGGGLLLAIGLVTRIAALVNLPILAGAVFLVHWQEGFFQPAQNLEFTMLVLFLLFAIAIHGGGRLSVDAYVVDRMRMRTST